MGELRTLLAEKETRIWRMSTSLAGLVRLSDKTASRESKSEKTASSETDPSTSA